MAGRGTRWQGQVLDCRHCEPVGRCAGVLFRPLARVGQKGVDHLIVLFGEQRAGAVDEGAARSNQGPEVAQHGFLHCSGSGHILCAPKDFDVRVPAQGTGAGAGRVQEYEIKARRFRLAVGCTPRPAPLRPRQSAGALP